MYQKLDEIFLLNKIKKEIEYISFVIDSSPFNSFIIN